MTDIYDTAVNPEPDDLYDEAMPRPVRILLYCFSFAFVLVSVLRLTFCTGRNCVHFSCQNKMCSSGHVRSCPDDAQLLNVICEPRNICCLLQFSPPYPAHMHDKRVAWHTVFSSIVSAML